MVGLVHYESYFDSLPGKEKHGNQIAAERLGVSPGITAYGNNFDPIR